VKLQTADWIAIASFTTSLVALVIALLAIVKGDRNASAALALSFNESFRSAWQRVLAARSDQERDFELTELMNLIEIASAVHLQRSMHGRVSKILEHYIISIMDLLLQDSSITSVIVGMMQNKDTFENIGKFVSLHTKLQQKFS
jgi:hypothetical protein